MNSMEDFATFEEFSSNVEMGEGFGEAMAIVAGFLLIFALLAGIVGLIMYIFQSVGLYTIAKRRGINHAWLSWIPVGCNWILGCIADQYRYVAMGENKNRRTVLLILSLTSLALSVVGFGISSSGTLAMLTEIMQEGTQATEAVVAGTSMGITSLLSMAGSIVSLVTTVFVYISLFDLYSSCTPRNNVLFLVLGIFFGFLNGIFIFACRNKDQGMPPRKRPAQQPQWHDPVTDREPWDQAE